MLSAGRILQGEQRTRGTDPERRRLLPAGQGQRREEQLPPGQDPQDRVLRRSGVDRQLGHHDLLLQLEQSDQF